jgi:hypothetical protein
MKLFISRLTYKFFNLMRFKLFIVIWIRYLQDSFKFKNSPVCLNRNFIILLQPGYSMV